MLLTDSGIETLAGYRDKAVVSSWYWIIAEKGTNTELCYTATIIVLPDDRPEKSETRRS
jgi:hypothetical protein